MYSSATDLPKEAKSLSQLMTSPQALMKMLHHYHLLNRNHKPHPASCLSGQQRPITKGSSELKMSAQIIMGYTFSCHCEQTKTRLVCCKKLLYVFAFIICFFVFVHHPCYKIYLFNCCWEEPFYHSIL